MLKEFNGLVEPQVLFFQGISEIIGQGLDFKFIDAIGISKADSGLGQLVAVPCLSKFSLFHEVILEIKKAS